MPVVIGPPPPVVLPEPAEDGSNLWELVYFSMGFHVDDDPATGFQLRKLCEALCAPFQPHYDLFREREGQKGWTILLDPVNCPARWLFYPAQVVGVRRTPEMSEAQLRAEIQQPTSWKRGQPDAIRLAGARTLKPVADEPLVIVVKPRTPEPGGHYIRTLASQTPDPVRTEAVFREVVPAWEMLDYEAFDGPTYADMLANYPTYADRLAALPLYSDVPESTLP